MIDRRALIRYAISRTLFAPAQLADAIARLGFLQADPIRAPARAQDLTLRHRVSGYKAGDLERLYPDLDVEEDFFINYGFLSVAVAGLMHPRPTRGIWTPRDRRRALNLLAFVRERDPVHPREVEAHFSHGTVTNYWGGASTATTHLLDAMHYRGWLRIARRDNGIRVYGLPRRPDAGMLTAADCRQRIDQLVDLVVQTYAPMPQRSLAATLARLRYAAPQWTTLIPAAITRARARLGRERIDGIDWYFPAEERPLASGQTEDDRVRFLAPFDPLVWDRRRFELFWNWEYRFEAYTPAKKRKFGYYALPVLFRDRVIGWANVSASGGTPDVQLGFVTSRPRDRAFTRELDAEIARLRTFLGQ